MEGATGSTEGAGITGKERLQTGTVVLTSGGGPGAQRGRSGSARVPRTEPGRGRALSGSYFGGFRTSVALGNDHGTHARGQGAARARGMRSPRTEGQWQGEGLSLYVTWRPRRGIAIVEGQVLRVWQRRRSWGGQSSMTLPHHPYTSPTLRARTADTLHPLTSTTHSPDTLNSPPFEGVEPLGAECQYLYADGRPYRYYPSSPLRPRRVVALVLPRVLRKP